MLESFEDVLDRLIREAAPPLAKHLGEPEPAIETALAASVALLAQTVKIREAEPGFADRLIEFLDLYRRAAAGVAEGEPYLSRAAILVGDGFVEDVFHGDSLTATQALAHEAKLRSGSLTRVLSVGANLLLCSLEPEAAPPQPTPLPQKRRPKRTTPLVWLPLAACLVLVAGLGWRFGGPPASRDVVALDRPAPAQPATEIASAPTAGPAPEAAAPAKQETRAEAAPAAQPAAEQAAAQPAPAETVSDPERQAGPAEAETPAADGMVRRKLPTGVELAFRPFGAEDRLLRALETPHSPAGAEITLDQVAYEPSKIALQAAARAQLRNLAEIMKAYPRLKIAIRAYTDNDGSKVYNVKLSNARAKGVLREIAGAGVDAARMTAQGLGAAHAVAADAWVANHAAIRRVSVSVTGM